MDGPLGQTKLSGQNIDAPSCAGHRPLIGPGRRLGSTHLSASGGGLAPPRDPLEEADTREGRRNPLIKLADCFADLFKRQVADVAPRPFQYQAASPLYSLPLSQSDSRRALV